MKRKMVLLAGLATLGVAAYLTSHLWAQQPTAASAAPASPKIGLINMAVVLKGYNKFKVYNDEIEKIRLKYEKIETDLRKNIKEWQDYAVKAPTVAEKEKAAESIKILNRQIEDNAAQYGKERSKKSDEQMVQMFREIEAGVKTFASTNGFHMIMHYSEPLAEADRYSAPNIQRKLVGPGSSGGVCPLYFVGGMDVSNDVVQTLNAMYPAPAVATAPLPK